jgi:hypothetical protein
MKNGGEGGIGRREATCLAAFGSNPRVLIPKKTVREGFEPSVAFWTTEL